VWELLAECRPTEGGNRRWKLSLTGRKQKLSLSRPLSGRSIVLPTDLASIPPALGYWMAQARVIMIDCNHAVDMLRLGSYPYRVKQQVASEVGHLSNDRVADFFPDLRNASGSYCGSLPHQPGEQ
jgi:hypothetical protein